MQRMGDPFPVGYDGDPLEGRMMVQESAEAQLEVLGQAARTEALVIGRDHLDDPDLAGLEQLLHGRLELAQVVATQPARHTETVHSLWHIWQ